MPTDTLVCDGTGFVMLKSMAALIIETLTNNICFQTRHRVYRGGALQGRCRHANG